MPWLNLAGWSRNRSTSTRNSHRSATAVESIGQEGGDEVVDVVAGGEAEDLGDDRRDRARRQAVAGHSTRLPEQQAPRLEVDHVACRDVMLLAVHDDSGPAGDDGDEAAEAARPFHLTISLVVVEHD